MPALRIVTALVAFALVASSGSAQTPQESHGGSELRLIPDRPKTGERISVGYIASADLAGEQTLVLRARMRSVAAGTGVQHRVAELERIANGRFRGVFELPDSVVYAVLAVEDTPARRVDHNGENWEIVVHAEDGRPLRDALEQRVRDLEERDKRLAYDAARELVRLYPAHVSSWMTLYLYGKIPGQDADSIRAMHTERLRVFSEQLETVPRPTAMEMTNLVFYGSWLGDTTTSRRWRSRLIREYPVDPSAVQQRVFALTEAHRNDVRVLLDAYEALWQEAGAATSRLWHCGRAIVSHRTCSSTGSMTLPHG